MPGEGEKVPSEEKPGRGDRVAAGRLLLKGDCDLKCEGDGETVEELSPRLGKGVKVLVL